MIGSIFFLCPYFKEEIFGLAFGVLVGGGVQLFIMVPSLLKRGFRYSMIMDLSHPGIRKIARLFFPMALGLAVMQINVLVGFLFGSLLEEGRISALRYANIVTHLPISLFGVSIATVVFPEISISKARGQIEEFKTTLATGLRMVTFSTLPAMVGLIVLRYPIIKVLFERGAFSPESTHLTSFALLFYSLGILSFSFYTILVRAFYALHDTRTPLFVGLISALTNVLFCFLLMKPLSHGGLALAGSISATLSTAILLYLLRKRIGPLEEQDILNTFFRSSISAIIMGGVCIFFINYLNESLFIGLVLTILAGTATYLLCTRMCGMEEPRLLLQHATKTKRGREVSDEPSD
jgi:putative peptidoglycan lipid II flippase